MIDVIDEEIPAFTKKSAKSIGRWYSVKLIHDEQVGQYKKMCLKD